MRRTAGYAIWSASLRRQGPSSLPRPAPAPKPGPSNSNSGNRKNPQSYDPADPTSTGRPADRASSSKWPRREAASDFRRTNSRRPPSSGSSRRSPSTSRDRPSAAWPSWARRNTPSRSTPSPPKPKAKDEKPEKKAKAGTKKEAEKPKKDSAAAKPEEKTRQDGRSAQDESDCLQPALLRLQSQRRSHGRQGRRSGTPSSRLFAIAATQSYAQIQFPRVDVTIDAGGTPMKYAFFLSGYVISSADFSYASISLNTAVLREGDITLEGKKHHVVLIDFNSNGRFDDEIKIRRERLRPQRATLSRAGRHAVDRPRSPAAWVTIRLTT